MSNMAKSFRWICFIILSSKNTGCSFVIVLFGILSMDYTDRSGFREDTKLYCGLQKASIIHLISTMSAYLQNIPARPTINPDRITGNLREIRKEKIHPIFGQ